MGTSSRETGRKARFVNPGFITTGHAVAGAFGDVRRVIQRVTRRGDEAV